MRHERASPRPVTAHSATGLRSPQTGQAITADGAPARLLGMHCPPGSGFPVQLAVTIHDGTARS